MRWCVRIVSICCHWRDRLKNEEVGPLLPSTTPSVPVQYPKTIPQHPAASSNRHQTPTEYSTLSISANAMQLRPFRAHLLDVVLGQGLRRAVHGLLLHVLRHVGVLDHCLPLLRHALLDFLWPLAAWLSDLLTSFVLCLLEFRLKLKTGLKIRGIASPKWKK